MAEAAWIRGDLDDVCAAATRCDPLAQRRQACKTFARA
jgi:hypothetical protein